MFYDLAAQLVGVVATVCSLLIFQVNRRKAMLLFSFAAALLWATHFFMLGAMAGAVMNLVLAARGYVFSRIKPGHSTLWVLGVFVVLSVAAALISGQILLGMLPATASIISAVAFWQKDPKLIRRLYLASNPLWLTYNVLVGSYPGVVVEVLLIGSNLLGQYRFDFLRKKPTH